MKWNQGVCMGCFCGKNPSYPKRAPRTSAQIPPKKPPAAHAGGGGMLAGLSAKSP